MREVTRAIDALPAAGRRVVASWVADIVERPRYNDRSPDVEYFEGSTRHVPRGGFWNDDASRSCYGVTKGDVERCRAELKRAGITLALEQVDAVLSEAVVTGFDPEDAPPEPRTAAERKAAHRERARRAGRCIICCTAPADPDRVTCAPCRRKSHGKKA